MMAPSGMQAASVRAQPVRLPVDLPVDLDALGNHQTALPKIAKDPKLLAKIAEYVGQLATSHSLHQGDARDLGFIPDQGVHLIETSPPYWTLKQYREGKGQMGHIDDYSEFIRELNKVWVHCHRVLVPGGRLICVVGDVCLSRRRNDGEHTVVPLHASIQVECRNIGFSNLSPIIWYKHEETIRFFSGLYFSRIFRDLPRPST